MHINFGYFKKVWGEIYGENRDMFKILKNGYFYQKTRHDPHPLQILTIYNFFLMFDTMVDTVSARVNDLNSIIVLL